MRLDPKARWMVAWLPLLLASCCGTTPGGATAGSAAPPATAATAAPTPTPDTPPAAEEKAEMTGKSDVKPTDSLDLGNGVRLELVGIPAGKFTMGCPQTGATHFSSDTPHEVTLTKPYYMGKYEVTQEQYEAVVGSNPSRFKGPKRPVEKVSWTKAVAFCEKLSAKTGRKVRLPTEAEWEYACRAGTTTDYNVGATITTAQANFDGEAAPYKGHGPARGETTDVGSYPANPWGLHDMHGNVDEWCQDIHGEYEAKPVTDPGGPSEGVTKVNRGGAWNATAQDIRSASRSMGITIDVHGLGLRVVVEP